MALPLLRLFNALIPKDRGSYRLAFDLAYGSDARQRLDIYAPCKPDGPRPVVDFIYGGSWNSGSRSDYEFAGRALAALGYVAVIADYRVLPEVEYPLFLDDCAAALDWIGDNIGAHGGDPDRLALVGHSAGAYNAAMLALDPRYGGQLGRARVRAVANLCGPYDFHPFDGPISLRTFGAVRDGAATQPIRHVTATAPPMLLATGERDRLVHPRNTAALATALGAAGVATRERHYRRLGHSILVLALARLVRHVGPVLPDIAEFLAEHLADTRHTRAAQPPRADP